LNARAAIPDAEPMPETDPIMSRERPCV
jgi:hypothetical protein